MSARRAGLAGLVAASLAIGAAVAVAEPQLEPPRLPAPGSGTPAPTDSATERLAREASHKAYSTLNASVGFGALVAVSGLAARAPAVVLTGATIMGVGSVIGPAPGWGLAGYPGRAGTSVVVRLGIVAGAMAIPIVSGVADEELGIIAVILAGTAGVGVSVVEAYIEAAHVGPYVREHGPGGARLSLEPCASPTGAPAVALVARFP